MCILSCFGKCKSTVNAACYCYCHFLVYTKKRVLALLHMEGERWKISLNAISFIPHFLSSSSLCCLYPNSIFFCWFLLPIFCVFFFTSSTIQLRSWWFEKLLKSHWKRLAWMKILMSIDLIQTMSTSSVIFRLLHAMTHATHFNQNDSHNKKFKLVNS